MTGGGSRSPEAVVVDTDPFDGDVTRTAMDQWLGQFAVADQPTARLMLQHFRYYSYRRVERIWKSVGTDIAQVIGDAEDAVFVPVGYLSGAGSVATYLFCTVNEIRLDRLVSLDNLLRRSILPDRVIFLDDYVGTGRQVIMLWRRVVDRFGVPPKAGALMFAAIAGTVDGAAAVRRDTGFHLAIGDPISDDARPFSGTSSVFASEVERDAARETMLRYGRPLNPDAPLGFTEQHNLVGFFYSTLSNTLPVFWSSRDGWKPLLPTKDTLRGDRQPGQVHAPASPGANSFSDVLDARDLGLDIDAAISSLLFEEFRHSDAFLALAPVVRSMGLSYDTLRETFSLFRALKYFVHERTAVASGVFLLAGNTSDVVSGGRGVPVRGGMRVGTSNAILALAQLATGSDSTLAVTCDGVVRGILAYPMHSRGFPGVPVRWQLAAEASARDNGLLFVFDGAGRGSLFHDGWRLLVYRDNVWEPLPRTIDLRIADLARASGTNESVLRNILQIALEIADASLGALMTVGNVGAVLGLSDQPLTDHLAWTPTKIDMVPSGTLVRMISRDGATIVDADGRIIQMMTFLRPPADARGEEEVGRGSKHSTAAKISAAAGCLAVTVSADGSISVFHDGRRAFRMQG